MISAVLPVIAAFEDFLGDGFLANVGAPVTILCFRSIQSSSSKASGISAPLPREAVGPMMFGAARRRAERQCAARPSPSLLARIVLPPIEM